MENYFSRSCNKTSRKFFEDFDLLPREVKMLLCHQSTMPTFEDLKTAWDIAAETFSIDKLKTDLHVYEEERKAEAKRLADLERQKKRNSTPKLSPPSVPYVGRLMKKQSVRQTLRFVSNA